VTWARGVRAVWLALAVLAVARPSACGGELVVPASKLRIREVGGPLDDGGWNLWSDGAVAEWFVAARPGRVRVVVRAQGRPAQGVFPLARLRLVDASQKERAVRPFTVSSEQYRDYPFDVEVGRGPFGVYVHFVNDHFVRLPNGKDEDRNLLIKEVRVMNAKLAEKVPSVLDGADERIRKYRTAQATLTLTGADGKPLADAEVTVRMIRHRFLFGCNIFKLGTCRTAEQNRLYGQRFRELLNYATLPFYWQWYEPQPGRPKHESRMKVARWCRKNGIRTKGHPLFWTHEPPWVGKLAFEKGAAKQWGRIEREIKHFAGLIDIWDVLNEPVVGIKQARKRNAGNVLRLYQKYGRAEVVRLAFEHARKAGPKAILVLNDYMATPAFAKIIEEGLKKGAPIDVIGIQSHMHRRYWGALRTWQVCERFARFGKPIHFTETTIVSGPNTASGWNTTPAGEKKQAEQAAEFYTLLFSHPAVEAITWWDFADQGAWRQAPAGFLRKDLSPKPVYHALMKRIKKDWWTGPLTLKTDAAGRAAFRGFLGDYTVETAGRSAKFSLDKAGTCDVTATVRR